MSDLVTALLRMFHALLLSLLVKAKILSRGSQGPNNSDGLNSAAYPLTHSAATFASMT